MERPGILVIPGFFVAVLALLGTLQAHLVGHLGRVVVEFISALLHGVRPKNRHSSLKLMRVADAGLTSEKPAGKFEKLLRSDP
jgi:hypothetical protein